MRRLNEVRRDLRNVCQNAGIGGIISSKVSRVAYIYSHFQHMLAKELRKLLLILVIVRGIDLGSPNSCPLSGRRAGGSPLVPHIDIVFRHSSARRSLRSSAHENQIMILPHNKMR